MSREQIAELYQRTGALVLRRCRLLLRDNAEAEDVLQEVFVRLMRYGASVEGERVPLSWLYRTAERCCFDRLRRRTREPLPKDGDAPEPAAPFPEAERREEAELIQRFFHKLPPKLMQVALLHYQDGLPQERIAIELDWSRRTVGKKIQLLRERAQRLAKRELAR